MLPQKLTVAGTIDNLHGYRRVSVGLGGRFLITFASLAASGVEYRGQRNQPAQSKFP
jgi:hypothetical protein